MIYGDDSYPPGHPGARLPFFEIRTEDRPVGPRPTELPSPQVQARIVELGRQNGWGPERINAHMRHKDRMDVPVDTIWWILNQPQ